MFEFRLLNVATGERTFVLKEDREWRPNPRYAVLAIKELPNEDEPNEAALDAAQRIFATIAPTRMRWDARIEVGLGDFLVQPVGVDEAAHAPVLKPKAVKEKPNSLSLSQIKIGDLFKYPTLNKYTGLGGKLDIRAPTTFVGVEVELENVVLKTNPPNTCRKTDDGSLKIRGAEFITIPIQFKYLEVELDRLFSSLNNPLISSRCSVHVHLNARDFTLDELKTFVALYMVFERSLYKLSGDRWNNIFCVPVQMYTDPVSNFFRYIDQYKKVPQDKYAWYKYYGLNLSPLFGGESSCIGTIEFRQMAGSANTETIINWINLIVSLKLYAKKTSSKEFLAKLEDMNTSSTYYGLAEDVFGAWSDRVVKLPEFKEDVEGGITLVKRVFFPKVECKEEIQYNFKKES